MKLTAGSRLGPYEVSGLIGAGGMGEVYRARDRKLGRDVALKILPDAFGADAERLTRFEREAKILASLNHPNIAQIYGLEDAGQTHALVLELVEGPTLADRMALCAIALEDALAIAHQITLALEAAHEQGIIHRDLKPANIKVRDDGVVKVLDFGLAKAFDVSPVSSPAPEGDLATMTSPAMTEHGMILGTAAYMAPEQAKGKIVDKRADIWSFGVVLYEMLTGRRLFRGQSVTETLAEVLKSDLDWSAIPAGTPESIRQLLHRCLEREPKDRLRDIGEARVQIQRAMSGERAEIVRRRGSSLWIGMGLAAAGPIGAGSIWLNHVIGGREARSFQIESGPKISGARVSPNGRFVVFVNDGQLVVHDVEGFHKQVLEGLPGRAASPFWSPDSEQIGYFIDNTVHAVPAGGGPDQLMTPSAFANMGAAWCKKGIVVTRFKRGLWLVVDGGDQQIARVDTSKDELFVVDPACLPDGRVLATVVMQDAIRSYMAIVDGTNRIPLTAMSDRKEERLSAVFVPPDGLMFVQSAPNPGVYREPVARDLSRQLGPAVNVLPSDVVPPLSVSDEGTLVVMSNVQTTVEELRWVDRNGNRIKAFGKSQPVHFLSASPDGLRVALTTEDDPAAPGIYLHEAATSKQLTSTPKDASPALSPTGDRIAFISGADRGLWVRPAGIGEPVRIVEGPVGHPAWSPDGKSLVYLVSGEHREIWVTAIGDRSSTRRLVADGIAPAISSDGQWLAFTALDGVKRNEVYVTTYPTPGKVTQASIEGGWNPRWGVGSNELFYAAGPNPGADSNSHRDLCSATIDAHGDVKAGSRLVLFDALAQGLALDHQGSRTYDVGPGGQTFVLRTTGQRGEPVIIAIQNLEAWIRRLK